MEDTPTSDRKRRIETPDATPKGVAAPGKPRGRVVALSTGLCVNHLCATYLSKGSVYDGEPIRACQYKDNCQYSHDVPKAPVPAAAKAEMISLLRFFGPEKKRAMQTVMARGTF